MKPKILVIIGPTAVGKSDLAVELAKKFNGEIISADSRQVYRGMDIGSGKITKNEMKGIPHHLLNVANPKQTYTVAKYQNDAMRAVKDIISRGKLPIVCGGTGFYIQALVDGIILPDVPPNAKLRKTLEKKSVVELYKILQKLDPIRAKNIDKANPRRLVRAIEIAKALGTIPPISKDNSLFNPLFIGLTLPKEKLQKNIEKRYDKRIKKGMAQEVKRLHSSGLSWKRLESFGLEYRVIAQFLQDKISKDEMRQRIITESMQYAKRQMQWWKKDQRIKWITPSKSNLAKKLVTAFLKSKNRV
ncbi:MAG: tRNA (adenosine(37)-N6)-dimethylallyltransferase MiaA [Candidatus Paceibacterota bacterium]|jgi:tRNA dimethylallyltransferase